MALAKATHKPTIDIVANPRVEKGITPKQEDFARIYVKTSARRRRQSVQDIL